VDLFQEPRHLPGQIAFVESIGDQHQIGTGRGGTILIQDVSTDGQDRCPVGIGVNPDSGDGERIDVISGHGRCPRPDRGDRHQPRTGGNVNHASPPDGPLVVKQVAGQRLAASPRERPERRV